MSSKLKNIESESHSKIITELHSALEKGNLEAVINIVGSIGAGTELDDISQSFLLTYHYNFKTKFFEKAEFKECLKFSDILNKRTAVR